MEEEERKRRREEELRADVENPRRGARRGREGTMDAEYHRGNEDYEEDFWLRDGNLWIRQHIHPRRRLFIPTDTRGGPECRKLEKYRSAIVIGKDGTIEGGWWVRGFLPHVSTRYGRYRASRNRIGAQGDEVYGKFAKRTGTPSTALFQQGAQDNGSRPFQAGRWSTAASAGVAA